MSNRESLPMIGSKGASLDNVFSRDWRSLAVFSAKRGSGWRVDASRPLAKMPLRVAASIADWISLGARREDRTGSVVNSVRDTIRAGPFFLWICHRHRKMHFNSFISSMDVKRGPRRGFGMGVKLVPEGNIKDFMLNQRILHLWGQDQIGVVGCGIKALNLQVARDDASR